MDHDLIKKIDLVVTKVNIQKADFEHHLNVSTENLRRLQEKGDSLDKRYRYDLEKFNLGVISAKAGINKSDLYVKRCLAYKQYIESLNLKDLIASEKAKFQFIKAFQEETIMDLNNKLAKNKQKRIIESTVGKQSNSLELREELLNRREDIFERFLEMDFVIDDKKINTTFYLNYNTEELVDVLYPKKGKKRQES